MLALHQIHGIYDHLLRSHILCLYVIIVIAVIAVGMRKGHRPHHIEMHGELATTLSREIVARRAIGHAE